MTDDEMKMISHAVAEELHHIDEAHDIRRMEEIIAFTGLIMMIALIMVGLDIWSPMPPVAAEVIKQVRSR